MRIVVSGTHASGKSTLISDFASHHPEYTVLPDPFEELEDPGFVDLDARLFAAQLEIAAARLDEAPHDAPTIAERGPHDFVAYLDALERLGRRGRSRATLVAGAARARAVETAIDLWVVLPLAEADPIEVSEDEDPDLRLAMNDALLDLVDEAAEQGVRVLELMGTPGERLAQLEAALRSRGGVR